MIAVYGIKTGSDYSKWDIIKNPKIIIENGQKYLKTSDGLTNDYKTYKNIKELEQKQELKIEEINGEFLIETVKGGVK